MPARIRYFLAFFLLLETSCAKEPAFIGSDPTQAVPVIRAAYEGDNWQPSSSTIHTVEYFADSPRKFLIVTFRRREGGTSKPYLYEGFPPHLWEEWRRAPSAGTWYNSKLKGRFPFLPR